MSYRKVLIMGAVSRVVVVLLGCALPSLKFVPKINTPATMSTKDAASPLIQPWYRWDAQWYAKISREGYIEKPRPGSGYTSAGFLPLLPLVMSLGASLGLDRYWVGLVACNIAFVVGLGFFAHIAFVLTMREDIVWKSCLLVMAYPWSYYFSAPYQESLGFMFSTGAVLAIISGRPIAAAIANAIAPTARLACAATSIAILTEWFTDRIRSRPTRPYAWPVALAGGLGIGVFFVFFYYQFGDVFAHLHAHTAWGRKPASFPNIIDALIRPPRSAALLKDYSVTILFLGLGLASLWKRGTLWGVLSVVPILMPLASGTVLTVSRCALMSFPAFIEAGVMLRNRYAFGVVVVVCVVIQVLMLKGFVS
jgi:Mannosyltransferase (PIG-V)